MRIAHPAVAGVVEAWQSEEGWGVLRTPDGLSVWCHFSHVVMDGYKELRPGDLVRFDYETPGQDGCDGRVLTAAQPAEQVRAGAPPQPLPPAADMSGAYASELVITFDDE